MIIEEMSSDTDQPVLFRQGYRTLNQMLELGMAFESLFAVAGGGLLATEYSFWIHSASTWAYICHGPSFV